MTKIKITLSGSGGELDSTTITVPEDYQLKDFFVVSEAVKAWISSENIILSVGDTIEISELP